MKSAQFTSRFAAIALTAGLALAAFSKLVYDLFNGYAVVPNLLIDLGLFPSDLLLESMQFIALAVPAFIVGNALMSRIATPSGKLLLACALPWVALCTWVLISGMFGEHGAVLRELTSRSLLFILAPLLMTFAVPFGLWLAHRRRH